MENKLKSTENLQNYEALYYECEEWTGNIASPVANHFSWLTDTKILKSLLIWLNLQGGGEAAEDQKPNGLRWTYG